MSIESVIEAGWDARDGVHKQLTAFSNHYWPAFYFVDAQGQIRHHRFGEGDCGEKATRAVFDPDRNLCAGHRGVLKLQHLHRFRSGDRRDQN